MKLDRRIISLISLGTVGLLLTLFGFFSDNDDIVLIGFCIILGLDVKLIDQLIDDENMRKFRYLAFPLAILIPVLMGYLAIIHDPVFGMVMGTAIGLFISGKLDHPAFIMAAVGFMVLMVAFVFMFNIEIETTTIYLIPLAAIGAYGDEFGHEKVSAGSYPDLVFQFFEHRFLLKTVALISVIIGFAGWIHLLGFLCWDISYDVVSLNWKQGKR